MAAQLEMGEATIPAVELPEEVEEELERRGYSHDTVEVFALQELKAFGPSEGNGLPDGVRLMGIRFLGQLQVFFNFSTEDFFGAVTLLDALALKAPQIVGTETFPALCWAVMLTVAKQSDQDQFQSYRTKLRKSSHEAISQATVEALADFGLRAEPVTEEELMKQSHLVMQVAGLNLRVVSHFDWLDIYFTRLNILSCDAYGDPIRQSWQASNRLAMDFVAIFPTTEVLPPRPMAAAVFALTLARARLIPFSRLKPCTVAESTWADLLGAAELRGDFGGDHGRLGPEEVSELLQSMQVATALSLRALRSIVNRYLRIRRGDIPVRE